MIYQLASKTRIINYSIYSRNLHITLKEIHYFRDRTSLNSRI